MGARTESLLGHSRRDVRSQVSLGHGRPNPQTSAAAAHSILNVLAPIAQLVELRTFNPQVAGSSPAGGTMQCRCRLPTSSRPVPVYRGALNRDVYGALCGVRHTAPTANAENGTKNSCS